jgi:hypothetical protein
MFDDGESEVNKYWTITLLTSALALCASCHSDESDQTILAAHAGEDPQQPVESAPHGAPTPPAAAAGRITGTVVETMDSGGYTYVLIDTGSGEVWAAAPPVSVNPGDTVSFDGSMPMTGYHSPTLDRAFDQIYFTGAIELDVPQAESSDKEIAKAEGGVTVAEVFARSTDLVGTEIAIRGEVVKYNAQILGTNWLHIQDGTGAEGTNDLTVTTNATAAVGDIVLVRGVLASDRDFGAGYVYDLIVEEAQVIVD